MARRRSSKRDAEALGALIIGAAIAAGFALRFGWPLLPAIVAYAIAYSTPVPGVIVAVSSALAIVWLAAARQNSWPTWDLAKRWPVKTALIVIGPLVMAPIGINVGLNDRADEADRERDIDVQSAINAVNARAAAEQQARDQHERDEQRTREAARLAAIEASRTPADRAAAIVTALREGGVQAARDQLAFVPESQRCDAEIFAAARRIYDAELTEWRRSRQQAMEDRHVRCSDGWISSCRCNEGHGGCCSWHHGMAGCEAPAISPAPHAPTRCSPRDTSAHPDAPRSAPARPVRLS